MMRMDDEPVSPLCLTCAVDCNDQLFGQEGSCGLCCGGLETEQDVARDEDAVLDDVVIGFETDGNKSLQTLREIPAPKGWSAAQWRLHCICHLPYDPRCPFCVAGKRPNSHHRKSTRIRKIPFVSLDYCFLRDSNTTTLLTVLVVYVKPWRLYFALPVRAKGSDLPAIELLAKWLQDMSLTQFAYRSDREASIRTLMKDAVRMSRSEAHDATDDVLEDLLPGEDSDAEPGESTTATDYHAQPPLPPPSDAPKQTLTTSTETEPEKKA